DFCIVARQEERRVPVEPIGRCAALPRRTNRASLARLEMPPADRTVLAFRIDQVGIAGIDATDEAVAAADRQPIFVVDAAALSDRRPGPRAVVLQAAGNPVRLLEADRHVIELAESRRVDVVPVAATVVAA